ncbi:MAG TPA: cyclic nucleotide-binding domain-containing protein [bacterium]|nr:cyclic nucleotide-binding domain-containing protein [bacterium]
MFDIFGHAAFLLMAVSFMVKDIFWLRVMSIGASVCSIVYNFTALQDPIWLVIQWNMIFILINLYRGAILIQDKMHVSITEDEQELYETQFRNFSPVEFMKILRAATWHDVDANEILAKEGKPISYLMVIYCGKADVVVKGHIVAQLKDGDFIGEMSFNTDKLAAATVAAAEPMRLLVWNKTQLKDMLRRNPSIHFAMQSILSANLVDKLARVPN